MDASTSSSSAQEGETQDRLTAEFCVLVDFKTVKLNNSLVQGLRSKQIQLNFESDPIKRISVAILVLSN